MGWIDPTVLASTPPHAVIPFAFVPLWLIFVVGLMVSTVAIVWDRRRGAKKMKPHVFRTAGRTLVLPGSDRRFQRAAGKG